MKIRSYNHETQGMMEGVGHFRRQLSSFIILEEQASEPAS